MDQRETDRQRGRPRAFDEARFLDGAIALFSAAGFSGVGISDLTAATGVSAGSIYKAYQDKQGVFSMALSRYIALREDHIARLFETAVNARTKLGMLLRLYVDLSRGADGKLGCMVVAGIADLDSVGRAQDILRNQLAARRATLKQLITQGQGDGSVASRADPEVVADILLALLQGMRVIGKGGILTQQAETFVTQTLRILD